MEKITIIGLGLVGNSIGMGLKRAAQGTQGIQVVGFDPDRALEEAAARRYMSVDSIAPDLETAVREANLVILSTPASGVREVLAAIAPFVDSSATVTDTLSFKEPLLRWAGELLTSGSFVGGHPLSRTVDTEAPSPVDQPSADMFSNAPYCIMPLPSASGDALNRVIALAQTLGATPLFIDPLEHDSLFAAANHLPLVASAALLRLASASASWQDIGSLARTRFDTITSPMGADLGDVAEVLATNRQILTHWIDQYMLVLQDLRDLVAQGDTDNLQEAISNAQAARQQWIKRNAASENDSSFSGRQLAQTDEMRAELEQAIRDTRPGSRMFGRYLGDRIFGKKEGK